jgi:hypothetical protein
VNSYSKVLFDALLRKNKLLPLVVLTFTSVVPAQQVSDLPPKQEQARNVIEDKLNDSTSNNALPAGLSDAPSASSPKIAVQLTLKDRFHIYRKTILRPYSVVGPAFGAGIGQWEDEPPEWGQGAAGYARRFGSGMGRYLRSETIRFGVAAVDGEDPRYYPATDKDVWKRGLHAVSETFVAHTSDGGRMPAYSRFIGIYGAAFISNAWYPNSRATAGYALRRGSTALLSSVGFHLFEEFFPRKKFKMLRVEP